MANLSTKYLGMTLKSPVVVGACSLSKRVDTIREIEAAGAGALVIKSLFQEQIELEAQAFEDALNTGADHFAESLRYFPTQALKYSGAQEHLMWVREARKAVQMPLIASLSATDKDKWVEYAKQLQDTGVNALELNAYSVEADPDTLSSDIEHRLFDTVCAITSNIKIPVAVKLAPFYTSVASVCKALAEAGADGITLFNRFYQPDIDVEHECLRITMDYSSPAETRLPLRWIALLSGDLDVDFAASTGIHTVEDVARHLLAGAAVTQIVSALYVNSVQHVAALNRGLSDWMDRKGYATVGDFRGKVSRRRIDDPHAFERAQYIKLLLGHD